MARTAERTVTLILDAGDELADLEELRRLHSRPYGQILCEPDPTATRTGLAHHLLAALGKHPGDLTGDVSPWPLVECHLKAERVRDLVLARAQTLTYAGVRHVADLAHNTGIGLWLWSATERPTPALAQLLEARPHKQATVGELLERWRRVPPDPELDGPAVDLGAGPHYPWLTPCEPERLRSRTALVRGLTAPARRLVTQTWVNASDWIDAWLQGNPDASQQDIADGLHALVAAGDTASEQITRAQAAIMTLHRCGATVRRTVLHGDLTQRYGESRPCQWRDAVSRAAELADQAADPHDAALIVLSAIFRDPYTTARVRIADVTRDGAIVRTPWGLPHAVPPPLRAPLAAQYHRMHPETAPPPPLHQPLLPGTTRGRVTRPAIERALERLDAPASLWQSQGIYDEFEGPKLDGRTILAALNPISLFNGNDSPS